VRSAVAAVDPYLPTSTLETLADGLAGIRWPYRVFGTLFSVFALIALGLAGVGIFGVMAYSVGQRTAEIGLRMALGATETAILTMVMRTGVWQIAIGLGLGLAAALGAARFIGSVLTRVSPTDPMTFLSVFLILAAAGLIACWLPARRALRIDPLTALRHE
jgi:ABC-type antimicrobial peptide transport system permease subunit